MARTPKPPALTPTQAVHVLRQLVEDRKITHNDIVGATARMRQKIADLEQQLAELRASVDEPSTKPRRARSKAARRARTARPAKAARSSRKRAPSAAEMQSRALQGQYITLIGRIPERQRAKFKAIVKKDGREAAIKALRDAIG